MKIFPQEHVNKRQLWVARKDTKRSTLSLYKSTEVFKIPFIWNILWHCNIIAGSVQCNEYITVIPYNGYILIGRIETKL